MKKTTILKKSVWCCMLFFLPAIMYAGNNDVIELQKSSYIEKFNSQATYFIDSAQQFTVADLWTPGFESNFDKTYSLSSLSFVKEGSFWVRFFVRNNSQVAEKYILEVGGRKHVSVFYKMAGAIHYSEKQTGFYVPYPEKEFGDYHFRWNRVSLQLNPGKVYEVVIHYFNEGKEKTGGALNLAGENIWKDEVYNRDIKSNLLLGVFFGIAFFLAIVNFFYFFVYKDKAYIYYSLFIWMLVYYEASLYGMFDFTPLVGLPKVYFSIENFSLIASVIFYFIFLKNFLNTKIRYPGLHRLVNLVIVFLLMIIAVSMWYFVVLSLPYKAMIIRNLLLLLTMPMIVIFLVRIFIRGSKIDHIFIAGSTVLLVSGIASLIVSIFSFTFNSDLFFQIGVIIELVIFGIGLGVKSRTFELEKQEAQAKLIVQLKENDAMQRNINEQLEDKVVKRTMEIQAQNEELVQQQEELAAQRDSLEHQNRVIEQSMHELDEIKKVLEKIVEERTKQLKQANNELVNHNSRLEQYAYVTAHNLRGPVARLKGLIYVLEKTGGTNPQNQEIIEKIHNSALEMDDVLSDMNAILELKKEEGSINEKVNIQGVIDKVCSRISQDLKECGGTINLDLKNVSIMGNEPYYESIFYNLISNAIKYRSKGRKLQINIRVERNAKSHYIRVSDNGLGIDLEKFGKKLFGFYQRFHDHVGGKGLGLYLVKTQVESMHGTVEVESKINEGTTFTLNFPL